MDQIVQIFKALGDETRLKILVILSKRKVCAKCIANYLGISEAAVSQHIKVLKNSGIIMGVKIGYHVHYNIQEPALLEIIKFMEQMKGGRSTDARKWGFHIPDDCKLKCSANQNKCCKRNNHKSEGAKNE